MDIVRKVMVFLGDAAFGVLARFGPTIALWIISAVTGVAMLLIWRYTSNQAAIADVRRKIAANLLATRLFKDNLSVTFRAQRQIIYQALRLLAHSIRPMVIMTIPFVLIMVQIGLRYEYQPLVVGQRARVMVTMKSAEQMAEGQRLRPPGGVTSDPNDPCVAPALRTVDWRLTSTRAGEFALVFGEGTGAVEMPIAAGGGFQRVSRLRGGGWLDRLLYSAEAPIPAESPFESIEVFYPARSTPIFGLDVHWLITLLVLSIVFALIFKPILKVHI